MPNSCKQSSARLPHTVTLYPKKQMAIETPVNSVTLPFRKLDVCERGRQAQAGEASCAPQHRRLRSS